MAEKDKSFTVRDKRSSSSQGGSEEPKSVEEMMANIDNALSPDSDNPASAETEKKSLENKSPQPSDSEKKPAPPLNFSTFILSLSSSAAINFGGYQDPVSGHLPRNLKLAKQSIDILAILHEKTEGNLTGEEKSLLESALYELRMKYVEEVKKG